LNDHVIIQTVSKILIPFIQLYALYVLAHGELGPGGGFQAGAIFGASIVLYVLAFGLKDARLRFKSKVLDLLTSTGVFLFATVGILCIIAGGAFLQYTALPLPTQKLANALGIYGIEIGVFITVTAVLVTIFFETAEQDDD
jgi:multicomponent Na+:H+ antiporter subunit B